MEIKNIKRGDYFESPKTIHKSTDGQRVCHRMFWRLREDGVYEAEPGSYTVEDGTTIVNVLDTADAAIAWYQGFVAKTNEPEVLIELSAEVTYRGQEVLKVEFADELKAELEKSPGVTKGPEAPARPRTLGEALKLKAPGGEKESVIPPPKPTVKLSS